jgi:hypothetical protein
MDMTSTPNTAPDFDAMADAQGLTPAIDALTAAEITHYVTHTGGGCMVVEVPLDVDYAADGTPVYDGYVSVSADMIDASGFSVVLMSDEAAEGNAEPVDLAEQTDAAGVVALVSARLIAEADAADEAWPAPSGHTA